MTLSNSARRKPLTRNEMWALFYAAQSALHSKDHNYPKGALSRAMDKLTEQMTQQRRNAIRDKGFRDARKGSRDPVFNGDRLGSMETMSYDHAFKMQQSRDAR